MEANELSKNDDIAARREARRRKILENSKSRLTKITGREHSEENDKKAGKILCFWVWSVIKLTNFSKSAGTDSEIQPEQQVIYPDPEIERDVYIPQSSPFPTEMFTDDDGISPFDDQKEFFELLNTLQQQNTDQTNTNANNFAAFAHFGSSGSNPFFGNFNTNERPEVHETPLQKILGTKFHIGLLAMLTYLIIVSTQLHWNVFLIFLLWETAEIFILRQHVSNSNGIINVLFMFIGISPAKVNIVLKWVQLLNKVLRDVALFMFFFVLSHVCRVYWNSSNLVPLIESIDQNQNISDMLDDAFEDFDP